MNFIIKELVDVILELGGIVLLSVCFFHLVKEWILRFKKSKKSVFINAILGAIPGCSGAIVASTLFSKRAITFGALTAALIATMGDGAFILIAKNPLIFIALTTIIFITALVVGTIVDVMQISKKIPQPKIIEPKIIKYSKNHIFVQYHKYAFVLFWFLAPGWIIISLLINLKMWTPESFFQFKWFAIAITLLILLNAFITKKLQSCLNYCAHDCHGKTTSYSTLKHIFDDVSFTLSWVIIGFLFIIILQQYFFTGDINFLIKLPWLVKIIIGAALGLIPGSGMQILFMSFYFKGIVPFAALLANAITTPGDATFLLLANNKKAMIYSGTINVTVGIIVAVIIHYLFPFF